MDRIFEKLKISVPTYNGKWLGMPNCKLPDFEDSRVPVLVCPDDGVRMVLGTHDENDRSKPDIQIERRRNGWMIFLHPLGGCDPSGYVFFLDDGRSFVVEQNSGGSTDAIKLLDYETAETEIDAFPRIVLP
jgi:hypothetical protein